VDGARWERRRSPPPRYFQGHGSEQSADFWISRQKQRESAKVNIWAPSPERSPSPEPERRRKRSPSPPKKAAAANDTASESESDSEDDHRRSRKSKKHRESKHSSRKHTSSSSKKKKRKAREPSSLSSSSDEDSDAEGAPVPAGSASEGEEKAKMPDTLDVTDLRRFFREKQSDDPTVVGPLPLPKLDVEDKHRSVNYGGALRPGEGSAMAAYVQEGKRIPRRGEIGLTSDQIELFENQGFVMSGSRHKRMNAVRMRKENQIISVEERRALAQFNFEEKAKKETKIVAEFRNLVQRLRGSGSEGEGDANAK